MKYIKPTTDIATVELQHMIADSFNKFNGDVTNSSARSKESGSFVEEERAEKNEYRVYNLWEE